MKIWKYPSSAALLINCCWSALDHELSLNKIAPSRSEHAHSFVYKHMAFVIVKNDFDELWWFIIWFFLCPQLIRRLFVFLLRVHCIAPRWSTFSGVSRNVDVIFVKDFANSIDVLGWKSFLFWNQISHFNNHVYSSLIVEMKSERCLFFWNYFFFWNSNFFGQRPNTLFNAVLWLSCILKTEMTQIGRASCRERV